MTLLIDEYLLDAVAIVSADDIAAEDFSAAINQEVRFLAGIPSDDLWTGNSDTPAQ
jgi:hypothetical protein